MPWTDEFVDISTTTLPKFQTKAKIRFDDKFLYIGAQLQEPQVWATLTEHDTVIFNDNDFEVLLSFTSYQRCFHFLSVLADVLLELHDFSSSIIHVSFY